MMDNSFYEKFMEDHAGHAMLVFFLVIISAVGAAKLFAKADRPWIAAFIPGWNLVEVMQIIGRPKVHAAFFLIPIYNIYFFFRVCIELAQSFGKYSTIEYVLVCVFNVFYVLNLALAYNEEYHGPVYGRDLKASRDTNAALA
jgi:hypothetical protein